MSSEELLDRITIDPGVCHGKPCIRGLRYPVDTILKLLGGGMSETQILNDYPDLEKKDFLAIYMFTNTGELVET
ncbi:MAG: DUF433 domain-containing protein [Verrucomicrobiota bacterium]